MHTKSNVLNKIKSHQMCTSNTGARVNETKNLIWMKWRWWQLPLMVKMNKMCKHGNNNVPNGQPGQKKIQRTTKKYSTNDQFMSFSFLNIFSSWWRLLLKANRWTGCVCAKGGQRINDSNSFWPTTQWQLWY